MVNAYHYGYSPEVSIIEEFWDPSYRAREAGRTMKRIMEIFDNLTEDKGENNMSVAGSNKEAFTKEYECVWGSWSIPSIMKVVHNEEARTTTIHWADKTKTTVHCGEGEKYEKYNGFVACVAKKLFGSTSAAKRINGRKDEAYMKLQKQKEQQKIEKEAALKREQKERKIIKRRAKEIYLQREAEKLADEMAKKK